MSQLYVELKDEKKIKRDGGVLCILHQTLAVCRVFKATVNRHSQLLVQLFAGCALFLAASPLCIFSVL